jgi:hypothetical protein
MKEMPFFNRPYEKIRRKGVDSLDDAELESFEREVTNLFFNKKVNLNEYHEYLEKIAESRNNINIIKKKNQMSMSSSKWN